MRLLTSTDVERLVEPTALVGQVEQALVGLSDGRAEVAPRVAVRAGGAGEVMVMGGHLVGTPLVIVKQVGVFMGNTALGLPTHQSTICGFDAHTGELRVVMDGSHITALRTAAVSALSALLLGPPGAGLAIVGTGEQAYAHALVFSRSVDVSDIVVTGRNPAKVRALADRCAKVGISVRIAPSPQEAVVRAGTVVAATHSPDPVIRRAWLRSGTHIASVGVTADGQEIDDETIAQALVVVESAQTAVEPPPLGSNEISRAVREGRLAQSAIAEIGAIACGKHPGRTDAQQLTLFKSVGSAAADAAVANAVFARAVEECVGTEFNMNPDLHTELHA
jgi:alanine dehydrogenase